MMSTSAPDTPNTLDAPEAQVSQTKDGLYGWIKITDMDSDRDQHLYLTPNGDRIWVDMVTRSQTYFDQLKKSGQFVCVGPIRNLIDCR